MFIDSNEQTATENLLHSELHIRVLGPSEYCQDYSGLGDQPALGADRWKQATKGKQLKLETPLDEPSPKTTGSDL